MKKEAFCPGTKPPEQQDRRLKILVLVLIAVLIILMILLMTQCQKQDDGVSQTAVIQTSTEELNDTTDGRIRIRISPVVQVKDGTMQDLHFCNYNEDRLLQCRIRVGDDYVYDSGKLDEGQTIIGDFIDVKDLEKGEHEALAEIYSYSADEGEGKPLGQTNVQIKLLLL